MKKERLEELKKIKKDRYSKNSEKEFKKLTASEKWEIVEAMAKMLGLIK